MTIRPEDEDPRPPGGESFADAVTFAFADPSTGVCGLARLGLTDDGASGLAVLFDGREPVAASASAGPSPSVRSWDAVEAGGVRTRVDAPLEAWSVIFDGGGRGGFDLRFVARSQPAELPSGRAAARLGGMAGWDQLCAVEGTVRVGGAERRLRGHGQRSRLWGAPDWDRISLARTVSAWLGDDLGILLTAIRPAEAAGHDEEAVAAFVVEGGPPSAAVPVADPRLSTTMDGDGRQRHATLELFVGEGDEWARRAAGSVRCGTTLDLGRLRLDCAFFEWRMEGRVGLGRYDVLRRAGDRA